MANNINILYIYIIHKNFDHTANKIKSNYNKKKHTGTVPVCRICRDPKALARQDLRPPVCCLIFPVHDILCICRLLRDAEPRIILLIILVIAVPEEGIVTVVQIVDVLVLLSANMAVGKPEYMNGQA